MSSDSSISDSDTSSGGEFDEDLLKAFQAVKRNLNSAGLKIKNKSVQDKNASDQNTSTSTRHRLIYQTFEKIDKSKKSEKKIQNQSKKSDHEPVVLNDFFIDKGPANNDLDNIVAYDLTNLSETVDGNSEDQDVDDVVSYDLTNIDGSANKPLENDNMSDTSDKDPEKVETDQIKHQRQKKKQKKKKKREKGLLSSKLEAGVAVKDVYINVDPLSRSKPPKSISKDKQKHKEPEVMKKCVISDDFERQDSIQSTHVSIRQQKKQRKLEREKTKGGKWFNMPATELTDERKYDLTVLQMRKALDPKRFYKANDLKAAPKYFQFGEVVEDATDFYSSRIPKKQRKSTVVEELLADAEFRKFNKRKYEEVQESKRLGKGPYKHMKRLKKRKK